MNLISCDCGVVLDKDKLNFPDIYTEEGYTEDAMWNGNKFVATVDCPVCGADILNED